MNACNVCKLGELVYFASARALSVATLSFATSNGFWMPDCSLAWDEERLTAAAKKTASKSALKEAGVVARSGESNERL